MLCLSSRFPGQFSTGGSGSVYHGAKKQGGVRINPKDIVKKKLFIAIFHAANRTQLLFFRK
jgi:hypothetical protein